MLSIWWLFSILNSIHTNLPLLTLPLHCSITISYRRCLVSILSNSYTTDIISDPKYKFSSSGNYYSPSKSDYETYVEFIRDLPMAQAPEVFGMDDNVDISKELQETKLVHTHTYCIKVT